MTKKETERDAGGRETEREGTVGDGRGMEGNGLKGEQRETERKGREWKE